MSADIVSTNGVATSSMKEHMNGPKVAKFLVGWSIQNLPETRVSGCTEEFLKCLS